LSFAFGRYNLRLDYCLLHRANKNKNQGESNAFEEKESY
jgi:hypothetical protein